MAKDWMSQRRNDKYYRKAKALGYRSRASFKLFYIHQKFDLFREDDVVLDLGAAPGGWSQAAKELVGERGTVIGVDLQKIVPIPGITFIQADITDPGTPARISDAIGGRRVSVVISDMAPNISGNYSMDHARSVGLCEMALSIAISLRAECFVVKIFQGDLYSNFLSGVQRAYKLCKGYKSHASRSESSELYIVGKGFIS